MQQAFGSLERAWQAGPGDLAGRLGWSASLQAAVEGYRRRWGSEPLAELLARSRPDLRILLPGDPAWPASLSQLRRPPLALHWQGRGSLWPLLGRRRAVAVVGTRRPSRQGLALAEQIASALAQAGWPVVSGLAEGIDAAAHLGCLRHGGVPIGVLGTPLDRVYPRHHHALQRRVAQQGLLLSEQPPGTAVRPAHFACRNRLQVSLARAVVVVECPLASGALHSAQLAWQDGIPLWVVPADVQRSSAAGSNRLLSQGATPLLCPQDLISALGPGPLLGGGAPAAAVQSSLAAEQRRLLAALGSGESLESLSAKLRLPQAQLLPQLLDLELAGLLIAEPGLCWRPR
ncbi:MAG: DNA-processing protein DprA [Synechococcaceae cyanobacterium]|nr:DNA-processing protein DprA [Synechococcaceae cyanobacterium]